MTPLFRHLLKSKTNTLLFITFLSLPALAQRQGKLINLKWKKIDAVAWDTIKINEDLQEEDCVNLYYKKKGYYHTSTISSGYTTLDITHHVFTKILTKEGLQRFADRNIVVQSEARLNILAARIYRADTLFSEYNPNSVLYSNYNFSSDSRDQYNGYSYSMPNLAIGDVVELYYNEHKDFCPMIDYLPLHDRYHTIQYDVEMIFDENLSYTIKAYNLNEQLKEGYDRYFTTLYNIESQENTHHAITSYQLPYILFHASAFSVHSTQYEIAKLDWESLERAIVKENDFKQTVRKDCRQFDQIINTILADHRNEPKLKQLQKINQYLNEKLKVVNVTEDEQNFCPGYYLARGYINKENFGKLYAQIADYLNLKLYYVAARDKYLGPSPFLSSAFYTDNFLAVEIDEVLHFIFFNDFNKKYHIDEFPIYLRGTTAALFQGKGKNSVRTVSIGELTTSQNKRTQSIAVKHPLTSPEISGNQKLKNDFSTQYRSIIKKGIQDIKDPGLLSYLNLPQNADSLTINVLSDNADNNQFNFKYTAVSEKPLTNKLEENLYYLNLADILRLKNIYVQETDRKLSYYGPYKYTDLCNVNYVFDSDVTLELENTEAFSFSNEVGEVDLKINQMGKILNCQLIVSHTKNSIAAKDYQQLRDFNQAIENARLFNIVIRAE